MCLIFDTLLLDICLIPTFLIIILFIKYYISYSYWKSRHVPFISPKFPFGNVTLLPKEDFNSAEWYAEMYKAARVLREKCIGLFIFTKPILVVVDPDMIESIVTKDSKYFHENNLMLNNTNYIKSQQYIFHMSLKYCEHLENLINNFVFHNEPINMMDIFERLKIKNCGVSSDFTEDFRSFSEVCFDSTISASINYSLYELSNNENVQKDLRNEIITILYKHNNEITYDAITEMKYLNQTIYETLRKYPPVPLLKRELKENYTFSDTNLALQKGIQLYIPILGLQNDIWYYPQPEMFNPDRFTKEEQFQRHPFTYLPFGNDPEDCKGLKLGILQIKVALIILLKMFSFSVDPVTKLPSKYIKTGPFSVPDNQIYLKAKRL